MLHSYSACVYVIIALGCMHASASSLHPRVPSGSKDVIIQMFEWTWDSIASECTDFIGPAGYGFVQASPAQEHISGDQWWTDYQPVSYILTSKRGDRAQYQNMIEACHAAGVKVIADTIWNHMAGIDSGTGVAGSSFTHYNYPGIYEDQDFHHCGLEPGDDIVNYDNRLEVQTCELDNLADLATETEYVRAKLAAYANDLISLGIDGLRLDAAKHMAATDVANMTSRLTGSPYITQEVIYGAGEPIQPSEYINIGDVQEFRYTTALQNAFLGGGLAALENLDDLGWVPSDVANVFVADHDTERNGGSLNANSPSNTYSLAHVFSLAHSYGTPTVLSSYSGFTDTDAGAPNGGLGTCTDTGGSNGWLCQHRWPAIAGMVAFRASAASAPVTDRTSPSDSPMQVAFGRGSASFVAINNADSVWATQFTTSLPAATYCDVIGPGHAAVNVDGGCAGIAITVSSSGTFNATVATRSALAIHIGATCSNANVSTCGGPDVGSGGGGTNTVEVVFEETASTVWGENIFLVGSLPELGAWNTGQAIALSSSAYPVWTVALNLPVNTSFQYKFIRVESDGSVVWESDPNRSDTTPTSGEQTLQSTWR